MFNRIPACLQVGFTLNWQHLSCLVDTQSEDIMSTVEERVKKIVCEQLGVKESEVQNSSSFVEDLGADSLDTVELVMALEEEFETDAAANLWAPHHLLTYSFGQALRNKGAQQFLAHLNLSKYSALIVPQIAFPESPLGQ